MALQLVPAAELDLSRLAALFSAAYEQYLVPIHADEARLAAMVRWWDLDLAASQVALRDGEPIGLALLGLRGSEAWVGGVGVVPPARRGGAGESLMRALADEARSRGAVILRLEVIRENVPAIALYLRLGFERTRDLDVWSVPGSPAPVDLLAADEAHRLVRELRTGREPWQRADGTVANLDMLEGIAAGGAAAVVRVSDGRVQIVQAAGPADGLEEVVRSAAALGDSLHALNVDPADPLTSALVAAGGRVDVGQHEMALQL